MNIDINNLYAILHAGMPIWILVCGAALCILFDSIASKKMASVIYGIGIASLLGSLYATWQLWITPELLASQNLLVIDLTTLFFIFLVNSIGIITLLNSVGYLKIHEGLNGEFCSLILCSIIGMIFLFASNHLFVNFIGLETMSLSIYVLVGSHKHSLKSNEAALKYFILGGVASAIMLYGIALFYGAFSTLNLSILSNLIAAQELVYLKNIALGLLLLGLFFKMAVVPFHFWAPDVYEGAPAPVTGFMATAVKTAAFGFALRIFTELDVLNMPQIPQLLTVIVIATLVVGNLLALVQNNVKRILAYSSISHAGFLLFGLLAGFENGHFNASNAHVVMFYLLAYFSMTLGAFAVLSLLTKERSEACDFSDLAGLGKKHPVLAGLFTLFMLSMVGLPGTVGFTAKFNIIYLAIQNNHIGLSIIAVITSIISVYYYLKPSVVMFFTSSEEGNYFHSIPVTVSISLTICSFLVIYLGFNPDVFLKLSQIAVAKFH
jgi:NADH-quinone oxidoreductase subunit N